MYAVALLVILLDQISKARVLDVVGEQEGNHLRLVGDLLWLRIVHNSGAAFGMLRDASLFFALAAVAVAAGIVLLSGRLATASLLVRLALGLELGGALGNLVDRVRYGYVVDFIDVRLPFWPYVFNVADAAITVGVVLLLLSMLRSPDPEPRPARERQAGGHGA